VAYPETTLQVDDAADLGTADEPICVLLSLQMHAALKDMVAKATGSSPAIA
jgi:hypothetical protein